MKKIVVYVLPVDEYDRYDEQNLSVDSLNELDNVDRYPLEDFIEACNNEEINLVNVWIAYREIEELDDSVILVGDEEFRALLNGDLMLEGIKGITTGDVRAIKCVSDAVCAFVWDSGSEKNRVKFVLKES